MLGFAAVEPSASRAQIAQPLNPTVQAKSADLPEAPTSLKSLPRNLYEDQRDLWTTPFRMKTADWQWTVPLGIVGAGLLASDTAIEKHVSTSPGTSPRAVTFSNAGLATLIGTGGGMFLWGHLVHDEQRRETGLLSGEAAIDAVFETEVLKSIFGRERPFTGDGRGLFFQCGSSFPSLHATGSWAIASVIAHEYPGPLTQLLAYGLAGAVSAARVEGRQHFATDVLVGSALGWYTGRQVFRSHSQYSDASSASAGGFGKTEETVRNLGNMGSASVPLDSWIYPAMERLAALGYIQSAFLGTRPWSRMTCASLLANAGQRIQDESAPRNEAQRIYAALSAEFGEEMARREGAENLGITLDSVYTRLTGITGAPLHDGFHFGQTIVNDYGRPYGEGVNNVTGISGRGEAGPLFFYLRGEYQHAPSVAGLSAETTQTVQAADGLPVAPPTTSSPAVNQFQLLEVYAGMQLNNWQFTFGKQSLWWGPDSSGPMLFSTNAAPILMLRISRSEPFYLPSALSVVGPIRIDYFVGRLSGYHWVFGANTGFLGSWTESLHDQPFIVGEKLSFKPTENLELGFSETALFGGPGVPATGHALLKAMFSRGNGAPGTTADPGDRRGGFDFAYRIPKLRNLLSLYADAFTDDEPNPWLAWNKSAVTAGLYLSRVPKIPKLDLRLEGIYSDPPGGIPVVQHGFFYNNDRFRSGYTNDGNLIGSWIGRQGQGAEAWATYWFTPKSKLQFNFRHEKVSQQFIPAGGNLTDFGVSNDFWVRSNLCISPSIQYERWLFPVIQSNPSKNVTAAIQVSLQPREMFHRSHPNAP